MFKVVIQLGDGDQRHLQRHDLQPDQQGEHPLATFEVQPGKGISGQRRQKDDQSVDGTVTMQRVDEGYSHPGRVWHVTGIAVKDCQGAGIPSRYNRTGNPECLCIHHGIHIVIQRKLAGCLPLAGKVCK